MNFLLTLYGVAIEKECFDIADWLILSNKYRVNAHD